MVWIFLFCVFVKDSNISVQECAWMVSGFISREFELEGLDATSTLQAKYSSFLFALAKFFSPTLLSNNCKGSRRREMTLRNRFWLC